MNKQELLEKLKNNRDKCFEEANKYAVLSWDRQIVDSKALVYMQVINWVEQIHEQPKVIVPKFVAEWIEQCKIHTSLIDCLNGEYIDHKINYARDEFNSWVNDNDNNNDEIVARAWLDGYEVKKTARYRVKLGNGYFIKFQDNGCLLSPHEIDKIMDFDSMQDAERVANTIGGIVVKVDES